MFKRILLAIFLFTLPLLLYLGNTNFNATKTAYAIVFISLLGMVALVEQLRRPMMAVELTRLFAPFLLIVAAMGLSLIESINLNLSLVAMVIAGYFFLLLLIIGNTVEKRRDVFLLLGSLFLAAIIAAGYGLLQYYGQMAAVPNPRTRSELILSTMGNKNFLGEFLAFLTYPTLALFLLSRGGWFKLLLLFGQSFIYMTLVAIDSDAAWLALAGATAFFGVSVFCCGLLEPLKRNRGWLLGLALVSGAWILGLSAPTPWNALPGFSQGPAPQAVVFPLVGDWRRDGQAAVGLYVADAHRFDVTGRLPIQFPKQGQRAIPIAGDWNGDGLTDVGLYAGGQFSWDVDLDGKWDAAYVWGEPDRLPVVGDWNGDGLADNGAYDGGTGTFSLAREERQGEPVVLQLHNAPPAGWPLAGDWNGDGIDELALYHAAKGTFWLDPSGQGRFDLAIAMQQSQASDMPVVGQRQGKSILGLFQPESRQTLWDDDLDGQPDRTQLWSGVPWHERALSWIKPSMWIRLEDWAIGWQMWRHQPWGIGIANYQLKFLPFKAKLLAEPWGARLEAVEQNPAVGYIPRAAHAHNEYVQVAAEMGLIGMLALGFALFRMVRYGSRALARRSNKSPEVRLLGLGLFAGLVAMFLDGTVGFPLYLPASGLVFVVILGALFSRYFQRKQVELEVKGNARRWAFALGAVTLCSLVVLVAVRDFIADVKVQEGLHLYTSGYTHLGARRFKQSLELAVAPQVSLQFLGGYYGDTNLYEKCVQFNEAALRALPTEQAYWDLSQCYLKLGDYDRALAYLKSLAAVDPEERLKRDLASLTDDLYVQVWEEWEAGDDRALQWLDEVASIAAVNPLTRQTQFEADYRGAMARMASNEGGQQGINLLMGLIKARPDHSLAYLGLGQTLVDPQAAKEHLQKSLSLLNRQAMLLSQSEAPLARAQLDRLRQWQAVAAQALAAIER